MQNEIRVAQRGIDDVGARVLIRVDEPRREREPFVDRRGIDKP